MNDLEPLMFNEALLLTISGVWKYTWDPALKTFFSAGIAA
jgi:hypothetical protein